MSLAVLAALTDGDWGDVTSDQVPDAAARSDEEGSIFRVAGVSYVHLPALNARRSAEFYRDVFGWELRGDPDNPSFSDGTGHVTGAWVTHRSASLESGVIPYIYVNDVQRT